MQIHEKLCAMQEQLINKFITQKRFAKYGSLENYEKNLVLSRKYYIPLSILEVSLRNAINIHFETFYGAGWLINEAKFLRQDQIQKIAEAKQKIKKRQEEVSKDKLVAELSLGFWVNLFKKPYEQQMRINNLRQIFSNLPKKEENFISRKELFTKLNHIRNFRNRIFHHEKILEKKAFQNIEQEINDIIGYLSQDLLDFSQRLNSVH
jgi:hypothetical protein